MWWDWVTNTSLIRKRCVLVNRKGFVFHYDETRPHTSLLKSQTLLELERGVPPHPAYSSDLMPSDFSWFKTSSTPSSVSHA